jgi:hypothetical protein
MTNITFNELVNGNASAAGTNHNIRNAVWAEFCTAHPAGVRLAINGIEINLRIDISKSGKTTCYWGDLDREQYIGVTGSDFGLTKQNKGSISIQGGVVEVRGGGRYFEKINNASVIIL